MKRPEWDTYFMKFALLASSRSTCLRRQVGAIAVRDHQVLATGYNGAPKGIEHCAVTGCIRSKMNVPSGTRHELCRGVHAEQNVITQAAKQGMSLRDSTLYTTLSPCSICAKMIINAGVARIVYLGNYSENMGLKMAKEAGIDILHIKPLNALEE